MANTALTVRMKFRKYDAEQLQNVINNEESTETEVRVAKEMLQKLGVKEEGDQPEKKAPAPKAVAKKAPKKAEKEEEQSEPEPEATQEKAAKNQVVEYESDENLTPAEKKRLEKAEKEFDERQKNRKTPSKSDKTMKENVEKTERTSKRENLEESKEVPGMKVGSSVKLKDAGDEVGTIVRLYQSSDGKEKCMVKFGDEKPFKKRVTALELVEEKESKSAPKKSKK